MNQDNHILHGYSIHLNQDNHLNKILRIIKL
jgi:hypothetical protein